MIKKILTYTVAITTVVWSVGMLATPLAVGAADSGDLIKLQCAAGADVNDPCKAVYYLGADGKRYVFPNEKTYKTWYSDFSGVEVVSETEMSSYSIGGNVTYRPGVKLVKITTDPKVYAVAADGTLKWVTTGEIAEELYGASWASMVEDVADSFFVNYTVGDDIEAAGDYDKDSETENAATINDDKNLGGGSSSGSSLSVALAADTPASGIVVANSINNKFTKVNFTASADGDIVIDQIKVERGGTIASDTPFDSLALIDAATNTRIGNTKNLNSEHMAVFNKDITVPAGTTKSIYLAGNMGTTAADAGEIPSLNLYSVTLAGDAEISGTLPIVGNYQTLNGTITIGTLTAANGSNNPSAATQKVGVTNYLVSGVKLTAGSAEDFHVTQISFDNGGTASDSDMANFDLLVDDVLVATVAEADDGVVTFDLSSDPVVIEKGRNVDFDLQLDILSGSARTIRFDVKDESDIRAMGQLYGSEVKVAAGTGATADATPFWTAQVVTVDQGSLRIGPATLATANIPEDATQVVLGKFEFEAKGEPIQITQLPIHFLITTSSGTISDSAVDITSVSVYDEDGTIVSGPNDPTGQNYGADGSKQLNYGVTSTDTFTVPVGIHNYTVKADISTDFGSDDTIVARIKPNQVTCEGETTGLTATPTPSTEQTSATMTVKTAALSMSVSSQPIAQTVVAGTKGHTFANIILGAESSGEDVKVTKVAVRVESDASTNPSEVSNWSIFDGDTELSTTNDPDSQTSTKTDDNDEATSTFTLSTPLVIGKGTSKTLTVKGDIATGATDGSIKVGMSDTTTANHITAKGNDTGVDASITLSASDGQAQTFTQTGNLTITQDSDTPDAGYIPGSTAGVTVTQLIVEAEKEDVNIEKLYITASRLNTGGWDQVDELHVYNGSELVASVTPTATDGTDKTVLVDMTNNPIVVSADDYTTITLKVDTSEVNHKIGSRGESLEGFALKINAAGDVTAKGAQSGVAVTPTVSSATGNNMYLVRSFPTVTLDEDGGSIVAGTQTLSLYSFTVDADSAADIGLGAVSFQLSTTTATVSNLFLYQGGTKVATASTTIVRSGPEASGVGHVSVEVFVLTTDGAVPGTDGTNVLPSQSLISAGGSKTYTVKGSVECSVDSCSNATNPTGGSVVLNFMGDDAAVGTAPVKLYTLVNSADEYIWAYSMMWTDWYRTPTLKRSSTTASNTDQWINGYLVKDELGNNLEATSTGANWSK